MDVTFTNVLQGARQYFQGIPSSSNTTVRISSLTEAHCRLPSNNSQEVPSSEQFYPVHLNASSSLQSRNQSPVIQSVTNIPNSSNQLIHLQYNKERVEQGFSQYMIPYNETNESSPEQIHFRQSRILHTEHGEQEHQLQQRHRLQQPHQHHQQTTQQQNMYYQQQPKHHLQKHNYHYQQQHPTQRDYQFHQHSAEQTQSNSSTSYSQISQFHQTQDPLKSHYFPKEAAITDSPIEDTLTYPVSSGGQSSSYSVEYGQLKSYAWPHTYCEKVTHNQSDNMPVRVNSSNCYPLQNKIYSKNITADQNLPCDSSYVNTNKPTLQSDSHSKIPDNLAQRYDPGQNYTISNRSNRESIISSINTSRTKDNTVQQLIHQQNISQDNMPQVLQRNLQAQPHISQGNFDQQQAYYPYSTSARRFEAYENENNQIYSPENPSVSSVNRANEINNSLNANSSKISVSNHEQTNYMHSFVSNSSSTRKESPLDLSLRTIKTSADSTLNETDNDITIKSFQNKSTALKSTKHYPQFDVELFEKNLTHRSSQLPVTSSVHYDFRPNFSALNQSTKNKYYPIGNDQAALPKQGDTFDKHVFMNNIRYPPNKRMLAQSNQNILVQSQTSTKFSRDVTSVINDRFVANVTDNKKKRPADTSDYAIFNKMPKVADPWRKSIDMQIEERLSTYKQQQKKIVNNALESSIYNNHLVNDTAHKESLDCYQKQNSDRMADFSQSIIQENRQYSNNTVPNKIVSDSHSCSPLNNIKVQNNKFFGADKRVLNILRSSLEIKGKKKMEQQKANEESNQFLQGPTNDVRISLPPENSIRKTQTVSDTVISFANENNTSPLNIPQNLESVNFQTNNIRNPNRDPTEGSDNFAEFLAARIRTKGELKQGGTSIMGSKLFVDNPEHEVREKQQKLEISENVRDAGSPKICQNITQRKRVFSKNEGNLNNVVPIGNKSEIRSSSETSVFDFPDSDSEREDKESLEAMRKCRKIKQDTHSDLKIDTSTDSPCQIDNEFTKVCDDFLRDLKCGFKKKTKLKNLDSKISEESDKITMENSTNSSCNQDAKVKIVEEVEKVENILETEEDRYNILDISLHEKENILINNLMEIVSTPGENSELTTVVTENTQNHDHEIRSPNISSNATIGGTEMNENLQDALNRKTEIFHIVETEDQTDEFESVVTHLNNKNSNLKNDFSKSSQNLTNAISIIRPSKKPSFGDMSYFYPGWEEGVYKYKKSLRIPPTLIQISRPPQFHRLSTSLPDLDPYPQSPTVYSPNGNDTSKITQAKSESLESDNESDYNFNVFGKKINYDSEGSASVLSSPNSTKELSILDKLLEKYGRIREKKHRRNEARQRKLDEVAKLVPSASVDIAELQKKKCSSPKQGPVLRGYRKAAIDTLKEDFIKTHDSVEGLNETVTTVILKARTRKESRILKQRATIKEVFGEERPASAPPITFLNDINFKKGILDEDNCLGHLVIKLEKRDDMIDKIMQKQKQIDLNSKESHSNESLPKLQLPQVEIKQEPLESELESLDEITFKKYSNDRFQMQSVDEYEIPIRGKKKSRSGKMRRKLSSGFDYIRKKKKVKKEIVKSFFPNRKEKLYAMEKTPESIHDIHKEIKAWVLNKGIGETHLHRAARLGYSDVTAYCLENLNCNPSPKDNAGYTPLHEACAKGHLDIAKLLLTYGANPSESAQGGVRPLHEACENGYVELTRLLLSYGADPTLVTYSGLTPLALTNDEITKVFLKNYLNDIEGEPSSPWISYGPATFFDPVDTNGYNVLDNVPDADNELVEEEIQFEVSDRVLPNFYTLKNEPRTDRWILLQDLSNLLRIKSKDALLRQINHPATTNFKSVFKEMKMTDFLEQAECCQFLNSGEKINSRASKIALVKYTKKLKELLNIESITITR